MRPQSPHAAKAGLRAGDVYSLNAERTMAAKGDDKALAIERVAEYIRTNRWPFDPRIVLQRMKTHLRGSKLITNLNIQNIVGELKQGNGQYLTTFEAQAQGKKPSRGHLYDTQRSNVEEAMFGYRRGAGGRFRPDPRVAEVAVEIHKMGVRDSGLILPQGVNPDALPELSDGFVPAIRPIYIAIDFARLAAGHEKWGNSCMTYHDYVQTKVTFVCQDSFERFYEDVPNPSAVGFRQKVFKFKVQPGQVRDHVATMHNLYPLFRDMPFNLMRALDDAALGKLAPGQTWSAVQKKYGLGESDYFEGHFHGEIQLNREVKAIKIRKSALLTMGPLKAAKVVYAAKKFEALSNTAVEWI